jgi:hypothetical protein
LELNLPSYRLEHAKKVVDLTTGTADETNPGGARPEPAATGNPGDS